MKIGMTSCGFDFLLGGIEQNTESLGQKDFLSLLLQNIGKSLESTCLLDGSTENGDGRTLFSLLTSMDNKEEESKSEDSPALLGITNSFMETIDVLSLLIARDYAGYGKTLEILCEKEGGKNISQFENQDVEPTENFNQKPETRDSVVVEGAFLTPLQVLANHGILLGRAEEISVSPENSDILKEKNRSVLELNPGDLFGHHSSSEEWNGLDAQGNKILRVIKSPGDGSTCQFQRFVQKDRSEYEKTFFVVPQILGDLGKIPILLQGNQLSEENAQKIIVMDPENRFLGGWKQEAVYILKNQRRNFSEMRETTESQFEPLVSTEIEKESKGDQTTDWSRVFLRVETLKAEENLERKISPSQKRHTESFEILSFQEKSYALKDQTIESKDGEIHESSSLFLKRMEQVTEDIVGVKKAVDMFFKVRIEDGDPLILGLKDQGERILVNLRTEDKNLLSFLQTERESIRRDLDEKGIPASLFIGEKESGMAERKEKKGKDERRFKKGGRIWL